MKVKKLLISLLAAAITYTASITSFAYAESDAPFEFTTDAGITIRVGDYTDVLDPLGKPRNSGYVKGTGWWYSYGNFTVYTKENEDSKDTITGITISSASDGNKSTETNEGIYKGLSSDSIKTRYGSSYTKITDFRQYMNYSIWTDGTPYTGYQFKKGNSFITFFANAFNKIIGIFYN